VLDQSFGERVTIGGLIGRPGRNGPARVHVAPVSCVILEDRLYPIRNIKKQIGEGAQVTERNAASRRQRASRHAESIGSAGQDTRKPRGDPEACVETTKRSVELNVTRYVRDSDHQFCGNPGSGGLVGSSF